ncbi:MAG TPA: SPOR domain-containing protein, partial [Solirubrobacteraceae bacterium]
AAFTGDWPSGTKGFTVQLQTLPQAGTTVGAVAAAKSQASGKGATAVGALKSEEFTSLTTGNYVIYAGVYHKRAEAQKALAGLKKTFPSASVIEVSNGSSSSSSSPSSGGSSSSGGGSNINHPAPPSALEGLKGVKGKSYEERSKNLPNVVETG